MTYVDWVDNMWYSSKNLGWAPQFLGKVKNNSELKEFGDFLRLELEKSIEIFTEKVNYTKGNKSDLLNL